MQIKINYTDNHYILINLFDNPTTKKWFDHFSNTGYTYNQTVESTPPRAELFDSQRQWDIIIFAIRRLKHLGFRINFEIPNTFDNQQSTLNKLHRFFTYNILWYDESDTKENPFDPTFKINNITKSHWYNILDEINNAVHVLEKMVPLTDNALTIPVSVHALEFTPDKEKNLVWLEFDEGDVKQNYEYFNHTYFRHLVMLDRSILGKCILQTFIDNDDLSAIDCTGRLGSHGGFIIDINYSRQQIFQSHAFVEWVKTFNLNLNHLPYEFPIGYVRESTFPIEDYVFENKVILQFQNLIFLE